jgi:biotin carboxyl carrier protein
MNIYANFNDHEFTYDTFRKEDALHILLDGQETSYDLAELGNGRYALIKNGRSFLVHLLKQNDLYHVHVNGAYYAIRVEDERMRKLKELVAASHTGPAEQIIKAPIPGFVLKVQVEAGQNVKKGDPLLILEAMKMENALTSPADGVVKGVKFGSGDSVAKGAVLCVIG